MNVILPVADGPVKRSPPNIFTRIYTLMRHGIDPAFRESYERLERAQHQMEQLDHDRHRPR